MLIEKKLPLALFLISLLFATRSFAVGWEEVAKDDLQARGIEIQVEYKQNDQCHQLQISLPRQLQFEALGTRLFAQAQLQLIRNKTQGWQISPVGTRLTLPVLIDQQSVKISALCLQDEDLSVAYLSAVYSDVAKGVPMLVVIDLSEFRGG